MKTSRSSPDPQKHVQRIGYAALTERELDVLRLLALGHTKRETAEILEVKYSTIRTHTEHIVARLGITKVKPEQGASVASRHLLCFVATALTHNLITLDQLLENSSDL